MNTATTFETINIDQLADVAGGFDWGQLGKETAVGAGLGALGGAASGAVAGSIVPGPGTAAGAGVGALAGGVGGAVTGAANNVGKQMGWW